MCVCYVCICTKFHVFTSPFHDYDGDDSYSFDEEADCLVVGAGLSGCTLAHYLRKSGVDVLLTEADSEVGGNIRSRQEGGFTWEEGPNSFEPAPHFLELIVDLVSN